MLLRSLDPPQQGVEILLTEGGLGCRVSGRQEYKAEDTEGVSIPKTLSSVLIIWRMAAKKGES